VRAGRYASAWRALSRSPSRTLSRAASPLFRGSGQISGFGVRVLSRAASPLPLSVFTVYTLAWGFGFGVSGFGFRE
jgi:hypothetical protein